MAKKKQMNYKLLVKILSNRFIRGFLSSGFSSMALIAGSYASQNSMSVFPFFQALGLSLIIGGVSGGILAVDKALRIDFKSL